MADDVNAAVCTREPEASVCNNTAVQTMDIVKIGRRIDVMRNQTLTSASTLVSGVFGAASS